MRENKPSWGVRGEGRAGLGYDQQKRPGMAGGGGPDMDQRAHASERYPDDGYEAAPAAGRSFESELAETLRTLWRRRLIIAGTIVVVLTAIAAYGLTATPRYTSALQIVFEHKSGPLFDFQAAVAGQPQDEAAILTEMEVLKSRVLVERLIERLALDRDPEFNPRLRPPPGGILALLRTNPAVDLPVPHAAVTDAGAPAAEETGRAERQEIVDALVQRIATKQVPRSRAVTAKFTAEDPYKAAMVLNTLGELYLLARLEDKFANARRASNWLADRVQKLRAQVEESERRVEEYRHGHGLFEGDRARLVTEQLSNLNSRLTDAAIARRTAEANLAQARALGAAADAETAGQVLGSELIRRFREEELALERREAEAGQKYGPRHPAMLEIQAERQRLRERLQVEVGRILRGLENEAAVARAREAALGRDLQGVKGQLAAANEASVGLNSLRREAEANRLLLEKFMSAFVEVHAQEDTQSQLPDARIISPAPVPQQPSFPNLPLLLAVGLLGGSVLGVLLALAYDGLDAAFRSAEQLETSTGLPVIAHVPWVSAAKRGEAGVERYLVERPNSAYAEAIRSLATRLSLLFGERAPRSVLFTSAQPDEGKTSVALSLARLQAQTGRRVLFLDADLRRSRVAARVPGLRPAPGLQEYLTGGAVLDAIIQDDPASPAHLITAGAGDADRHLPADAARLGALLDHLYGRYQLVVVDTPPLLALADAQLLPTLADTTILVVRWGQTRRRVVTYALEQVTRFGGAVSGAVLSMVDVKKQRDYGYGDSGYYYGKAAKYYSG